MFLQDVQVDAIKAVQFDWLIRPMDLITQLGRFQAYLVIIGVVFWAVSPRLGARLALLAVGSGLLNVGLKAAFAAPRPFWVDPGVQFHGHLPSDHGFPSGHAQGAGVTYGGLWAWSGNRWVRWIAVVLIVTIGLSRPVLGVHGFDQLFVGYLVAAGILLLAFRWERPVIDWFAGLSLPVALAAVLAVSLGALAVGWGITEWRAGWEPDPAWVSAVDERLASPDRSEDLDGVTRAEVFDVVALEGWPDGAGLLAGLGGGLVWIARRGLLGSLGSIGWPRRLARAAFGGVTTVAVMWLLGSIGPDGSDVWWPWLEQALLGAWLSAGTVTALAVFGLAPDVQSG